SFRGAAQQKGISLTDEIPPDLPTVQADPDRLCQVLDNFISNALKFSVSGTQVQVRVLPMDGNLRVEVEDQGPGILPEELPLLFQEFARLSNKPTGGERSSGVGLAIARLLIELHGG